MEDNGTSTEVTATTEVTEEVTQTPEATVEKVEKVETVETPQPKKASDDVEALKADLENWKKHSRSHEDRSKALLAEKEEWSKGRTEYEKKLSKALTELDEAKAELSRITVDNTKNKLIAEYKLPAEASVLMHGTSEEDLRKEAEAILKLQGGTPTLGRTPVIKTQGKPSTGLGASDPQTEALRNWVAGIR